LLVAGYWLLVKVGSIKEEPGRNSGLFFEMYEIWGSVDKNVEKLSEYP
jgi:hypothetical protein